MLQNNVFSSFRYMAEARQRQKENIVTVQKCWGREFSGQAFLADPAVIAFTDFEVGQRYKKVFDVFLLVPFLLVLVVPFQGRTLSISFIFQFVYIVTLLEIR